MQLYREILKLSQSPIYFKQTNSILSLETHLKTRAESRETDINARSWTWALPDTLELPPPPMQLWTQLSPYEWTLSTALIRTPKRRRHK